MPEATQRHSWDQTAGICLPQPSPSPDPRSWKGPLEPQPRARADEEARLSFLGATTCPPAHCPPPGTPLGDGGEKAGRPSERAGVLTQSPAPPHTLPCDTHKEQLPPAWGALASVTQKSFASPQGEGHREGAGARCAGRPAWRREQSAGHDRTGRKGLRQPGPSRPCQQRVECGCPKPEGGAGLSWKVLLPNLRLKSSRRSVPAPS